MRFITPFPNISEGMRLLMLLGLIILGAAVSMGLAFLFYGLFNGLSALTQPSLMSDIGFVRTMQIFNQLGMFIMPALLVGVLTSSKPFNYLSLKKTKSLNFLLTVVLIFTISPLISSLMEWNEAMTLPESLKQIEDWMKGMEESSNELVERMLSYNDPWSLIINVIMIVLLPALGEELIFRSVLISSFQRIFKSIHVAVWISAFLFSAFHMQFYGFVPRLVLGLLFGYLFVYSGSVWVPVLAHFLNNGTVVVLTYLNNLGYITQSPDDVGKFDSISFVIISALISVTLIWYMAKVNKSKTTSPSAFANE